MIKIDFKDKDTNNYEIGTSAEDIVKNTYGRKSGAVAILIEGIEYVDNIKRGDEKQNGSVKNPDKIISFKTL